MGVINESGNMILQPIFDDITGPDKHGKHFLLP
ncbi:WG repeat-containing protein [Campylobacter coli]